MGALGIILLVAFVIVCIFSVLIVLVQGEADGGMGGIMGSQNSAVFGARSANVLTKTTYVLVTLFFLGTVGLALIYKTDTPSNDLNPIVSAELQEGTTQPKDAESDIDWVEAEMNSLSSSDVSTADVDSKEPTSAEERKEVPVENTFLKEDEKTDLSSSQENERE